jgi:hypothetical protein
MCQIFFQYVQQPRWPYVFYVFCKYLRQPRWLAQM